MLTDKECKAAKAGEKPVKLFDAHGLHLFISTTGPKKPNYADRTAGLLRLILQTNAQKTPSIMGAIRPVIGPEIRRFSPI
jgi:hypothetical protein